MQPTTALCAVGMAVGANAEAFAEAAAAAAAAAPVAAAWEVGLSRSLQHLQLQIMPVPNHMHLVLTQTT